MAKTIRQRLGIPCLTAALSTLAALVLGPALVVSPGEAALSAVPLASMAEGELLPGATAPPPPRALLARSERERDPVPESTLAPATAEQTACLFVLVDAKSGERLHGTVRLFAAGTRTSTATARGDHPTLQLPPASSWEARVSAGGHLPRVLPVRVPGGTRSLCTKVALQRRKGIHGVVLAGEESVPRLCIGIAPLGAPLAAMESLPRAISAEDGRFHIPCSTPGRYRLVAMCHGDELLKGPVVENDPEAPCEVRWKLPLRIQEIRLLDFEDRPHTRARVSLGNLHEAGCLLPRKETDERGSIHLLRRPAARELPTLEAVLARGSRHRTTLDSAEASWIWRVP